MFVYFEYLIGGKQLQNSNRIFCTSPLSSFLITALYFSSAQWKFGELKGKELIPQIDNQISGWLCVALMLMMSQGSFSVRAR